MNLVIQSVSLLLNYLVEAYQHILPLWINLARHKLLCIHSLETGKL